MEGYMLAVFKNGEMIGSMDEKLLDVLPRRQNKKQQKVRPRLPWCSVHTIVVVPVQFRSLLKVSTVIEQQAV